MNNGTYTFEVCANSVASCLAAQEGGAHRVELCAGIPEGGTTPSYGEITMARRLLHIRLHVIIRPRGGDFLYSPIEVETMLEDIRMARRAGADGLVFGCLRENGDIDIETTRRLIDAAEGTPVTFHRAFDHCRDPYRALDELASLGVTRILTSGQHPLGWMRRKRNEHPPTGTRHRHPRVPFLRPRESEEPHDLHQPRSHHGRQGR